MDALSVSSASAKTFDTITSNIAKIKEASKKSIVSSLYSTLASAPLEGQTVNPTIKSAMASPTFPTSSCSRRSPRLQQLYQQRQQQQKLKALMLQCRQRQLQLQQHSKCYREQPKPKRLTKKEQERKFAEAEQLQQQQQQQNASIKNNFLHTFGLLPVAHRNSSCRLRLIQMVQDNPILWDSRLSNFKNAEKEKNRAWELIGKEFNAPGRRVARAFKSLRESYRRELAHVKLTGNGFKPKWSLYDSMNFLRDVITE